MSFGVLADRYCNLQLPLVVLQSQAGFYIGTHDDGSPVSRESGEYFLTHDDAQRALESGNWTQRQEP